MSSRLYYFVDHVANYEGNHGIHRVSRRLARALLDDGRDVVFLSWLADQKRLTRSRDEELRRFARWGGPSFRSQGGSGIPLEEDPADRDRLGGSWLLVPELPYHTDKHPDTTGYLIDSARSAGMRIAFILHDLIPIRVKGYASLRPLHARHLAHLAKADLIVPISRHSAEDLRRYYLSRSWPRRPPLPPIEPLLLPDEAPDLPRGSSPAVASRRLEILCVGALEPRKNHLRLLRAFEQFVRMRPDVDCRLTLVGDHHARTLQRLKPLMLRNPRVRFLGLVEEAELADLYRSSDFTVFPSLDEGYGLPIVESLWLGRPVICASFGAMAEVAEGGGCLTVDTRRTGAIAGAIERLALDESLRAELAKAALARPVRSWRGFARDLMNLFDRPVIEDAHYWADFTVRHPVNTGVQRVTRSLARGLQARGVDLTFVTWNYEAGRFATPDEDQRRHLSGWSGPTFASRATARKRRRPSWLIVPEILSPPQPSPARVIAEARRLGLKTAFLFYDLIPLKRRQDFTAEFVDGFVRCWKEMGEADLILPISRASAEELIDFYVRELDWTPELARALIKAAPLAGAFADTPRETQERELGKRGVSILCVGTVEPRKNQLRLVEALEPFLAAGSNITLTIAGASHGFPTLAAELRARVSRLPQARYLDAPSDETLAGLYSSCDFTVYASEEEGFGLPVLESLWRGRPCVCHSAGAIAEIAAGGGCLLVDMRNPSEVRDGVVRLARDAELYRRLAVEAVSRPIKDWVEYARELDCRLAQATSRESPDS